VATAHRRQRAARLLSLGVCRQLARAEPLGLEHEPTTIDQTNNGGLHTPPHARQHPQQFTTDQADTKQYDIETVLLAQATAATYGSVIQLYRALGGGWDPAAVQAVAR
jgi:hypothetical protein